LILNKFPNSVSMRKKPLRNHGKQKCCIQERTFTIEK